MFFPHFRGRRGIADRIFFEEMIQAAAIILPHRYHGRKIMALILGGDGGLPAVYRPSFFLAAHSFYLLVQPHCRAISVDITMYKCLPDADAEHISIQ